MKPKLLSLATAAFAFAVSGAVPCVAQEKLADGEVKQIAEEAFTYAFPMIMNYGTLYEFAVDKASDQYKAPFNQLYNMQRVATPQDTTVVTPNSDTPYSFVWMDLRAEPLVLSVPEIEKSRYYSIQLIDLYTFNYGYMGSRTTGNAAGSYLVVGPHWQGETPAGIKQVFRSETEFSFGLIRTQLFNAGDIDNVKQVQAGYQAQSLSAFLKQPAPPAAPEIAWPKIDKKLAAADPFAYLNFLLQFCPPTGPAEVEKPLRAKFARLGIEAGRPFSTDQLSAEQKSAVGAGAKDAFAKIKQRLEAIGKKDDGWMITVGFGDRSFYQGDWTLRAAAAVV